MNATDREIKAAETALENAEKTYREAKELVHRLCIRRATEVFGVEVGMRVRDKKGREGVVSQIKPWMSGRPWLSVKQIKKDGSTGERELTFYDEWEITDRR